MTRGVSRHRGPAGAPRPGRFCLSTGLEYRALRPAPPTVDRGAPDRRPHRLSKVRRLLVRDRPSTTASSSPPVAGRHGRDGARRRVRSPYPAAWRRRVLGVAGGLGLILTLNMVRIASLYLVASDPARFTLLHVYVWPVVLVLTTVGYVMGWIYWTPIDQPRLIVDCRASACSRPVGSPSTSPRCPGRSRAGPRRGGRVDDERGRLGAFQHRRRRPDGGERARHRARRLPRHARVSVHARDSPLCGGLVRAAGAAHVADGLLATRRAAVLRVGCGAPAGTRAAAVCGRNTNAHGAWVLSVRGRRSAARRDGALGHAARGVGSLVVEVRRRARRDARRRYVGDHAVADPRCVGRERPCRWPRTSRGFLSNTAAISRARWR